MFAIQCTTCGSRLAVKNDDLVGQILACPKCGGMVLVERPEDVAPKPILPEKSASGRKVFPDFLTSGTESGLINVEPKATLLTAPEKPETTEAPLEFSTEATPAEPPPVPVSLSESELRTRKLLLGVLVGLLFFLGAAVFLLVTLKGNRKPQDEPTPQQTAELIQSSPEVASPQASVAPETPKPLDNPKPVTEKAPVEEVVQRPVEKPIEKVTEKPEIPAKSETPDLAALLAQTPTDPEAPSTESKEPSEPTPSPIRSTTDLLSKLESKLPGLIEPSATLSIDIPARLGQPIAGLTLKETPLIVALRTLSTLTEIPVTLDVDQLRCRGIRIEEPITRRFEGGTVGGLLTQLLEPFRLEPVIEDRQIFITVSPERRDRITERTFDVSDLVAGTKNAVDLAGKPVEDGQWTTVRLLEILRRLVDPVGFSIENPGEEQPSIRTQGDTLVVRNKLPALDAALRTLEQLRVVRDLPQTTDVDGEHLVPEAFGWDAVNTPLTLNYYQPTPLAGVLQRLETTTGLRILVDHKALHRALAPLGTMTATVRCDGGTVNEALEKLLDSVNVARLTYRIVDARTLEVTTRDIARQPDKMSIEVHRYETPESPLPKDETVEQLVRTIRSALEPDSWYEPELAETIGQGDIVIDRPSGCLIVRQSQPVQRQLRLWLGKRLDARSDAQTPPEPETVEEPEEP